MAAVVLIIGQNFMINCSIDNLEGYYNRDHYVRLAQASLAVDPGINFTTVNVKEFVYIKNIALSPLLGSGESSSSLSFLSRGQ